MTQTMSNLPSFNNYTAIAKNTVSNEDIFFEYIKLYNLEVSAIEDDFYILKGDQKDIEEFNKYWNIAPTHVLNACVLHTL